jgi:AraC family transcriptional regulator, transcriptional activator of pobA
MTELIKYIPNMENVSGKDVIYFEEINGNFTKNVQTDAYVVILCTAGKAHCNIEGKEYDILPNDLIVSHPNVFVSNAMVNLDFRCLGVVLSPSYFESILLVGGNCWDVSVAINRNPVLHLKEEDAENAIFNFNVLKRKMQHTGQLHYAETLKLYLQCMIYDFYDMLIPYLQMPGLDVGYSSAENIFKRFLLMVNAESPRKREVGYYADRLCITPKYLSAICKKQSGKTAAEIITNMTVNYIRNMLESSDMTVKQIANATGFDNLSFFGKFVKRELGVSPRAVRMQK